MPLLNSTRVRYLCYLALFAVTLLIVSACATKSHSVTTQQARVDLGLLQTLPEQQISYDDEVAPVLERRCVVCHACYDAPCQLKLSSPAGIGRGPRR